MTAAAVIDGKSICVHFPSLCVFALTNANSETILSPLYSLWALIDRFTQRHRLMKFPKRLKWKEFCSFFSLFLTLPSIYSCLLPFIDETDKHPPRLAEMLECNFVLKSMVIEDGSGGHVLSKYKCRTMLVNTAITITTIINNSKT